MGLRDITNTINADLESGLSREEIFKKYIQAAPAEATKYAYCIASIPTAVLRKKYLKANSLLLILLVAYAALTVLAELPIDLQKPTIFILLRAVVPIIFAYFVFHFHGGVYRLITLWCLFDLVEDLLLTGAPTLTAAIKLTTVFFIIVISWLISRKVFPNLKIFGPKQDNNGRYFL
jgi:hypothetical protein